MKTILERLGGGENIIHENEHEESVKNKNIDVKNNISNISNDNSKSNEESSENESLFFNISKHDEIYKINNNIDNNMNRKNDLDKEKKIKINYIKCTLSFLDKGKAIFVSENDDIFCLPSALLNKNIQVGNSYLLQIEKLNNRMKKLYEIESIQNKYKDWK